jgi:hypothetical protein
MYRLGSDDILMGKYTEEYNLDFEKKLSRIHLKQVENTRRHIQVNEPLKPPNGHKILESGFFSIFLRLFVWVLRHGKENLPQHSTRETSLIHGGQ